MSAPILHIQQLALSLTGKCILDEISFTVSEGEWISIIGPNGAGKTTLLRSIAGLLPQDSGEVLLGNRSLTDYSARERAKRIGYVPQAEGRMLPYTAYEFVLMARFPHLGPLAGISKSDKEATRQALAITEMEAFADRSLDTLSGGERQKVFVAAAVAQGASILLLDEPFTFLDYKHQAEVLALLHQLNRKEGHTILCVTHDLNKGVHDSDRILALKAGKRVFFDTPQALYTPEQLEAIYGTPFELAERPGMVHPFVVPLDVILETRDAVEEGGEV